MHTPRPYTPSRRFAVEHAVHAVLWAVITALILAYGVPQGAIYGLVARSLALTLFELLRPPWTFGDLLPGETVRGLRKAIVWHVLIRIVFVWWCFRFGLRDHLWLFAVLASVLQTNFSCMKLHVEDLRLKRAGDDGLKIRSVRCPLI
jgi:hypothetical protein